jgi:hypothetical protein
MAQNPQPEDKEIVSEVTKRLVKRLIEDERIAFTRNELEDVIAEVLETHGIDDEYEVQRIADSMIYDELINVESLNPWADIGTDAYVLLPRGENIFDLRKSESPWYVLWATYATLDNRRVDKILDIMSEIFACAAYDELNPPIQYEECDAEEALGWYLDRLAQSYGVEAE